MAHVIDSDQHLFEPRDLWRRYSDPALGEDALAIVDDDLGHAWLSWRGRRLVLADVQWPGETDAIGSRRQRVRDGLPPEAHYDEILPADYWGPGARARKLDELGVAEAALFPNYGVAWERSLDADLHALLGMQLRGRTSCRPSRRARCAGPSGRRRRCGCARVPARTRARG